MINRAPLAGLALFAASLALSSPSARAAEAEAESPAVKAALARLDAQIPLTSADHTALKTAARARTVSSIRVCGDPGNMPLSNIYREGYQNKIVELVAREMGASVSYFWRPYLERGMTRQTFESNDCDVLLDVPEGFERVLATTPLYRTTYVLAYREDRGLDIQSLDDPKLKELSIGTFQTSGLRMALKARGVQANVRLHVLSHDADLRPENQPWRQVQEVIDGQLDIAAVWGPFAGWLKTMKGAPLVIKPVNLWEDETPLEFDLAMGLRKIDWILKYKFDLVLEARRAGIEKILRDYGVPLVKCSKCVVPGDLPAHGAYTKPLEAAVSTARPPEAPDQKVTRERLEAWLAEGASLDQELSNAVLAADVARIEFLVAKGADVNKRDAQGYAAPHGAARNRNANLIATLAALGGDVNVKDQDGFTPLHHAVLRNHPETVAALAKAGADLEAPAPGGLTPLAYAVLEDNFKAAMALIQAGAPVETPSGEAKLTPLMIVAGKDGQKLTLGAVKMRVEKADPRDPGPLEIARALIEHGANVNAVSASGMTALLLAAARNNAPIAGLLVQSGANREAKTPDGRTAAGLAAQNGNRAVVSLLKLLDQAGSN